LELALLERVNSDPCCPAPVRVGSQAQCLGFMVLGLATQVCCILLAVQAKVSAALPAPNESREAQRYQSRYIDSCIRREQSGAAMRLHFKTVLE